MGKKVLIALVAIVISLFFVGCNDAAIASHNLSKDADMFRIDRRIVFYNGFNGEYILTISGKCSIEPSSNKLAVTCKISDTEYKKHYLGLSDNVTYFVEQMESSPVNVYHYKVIFKPQAIIPDIEFAGSAKALPVPKM